MSTKDKVDALFSAAKRGDAKEIAKLRRKFLQVTWYDDDDNTPLHHAVQGGHRAAVYGNLYVSNSNLSDR